MFRKRTLFFIISVFILYVLILVFTLFRIYNCFRDTDCIVCDQIKENSVVNR